MATATAFAYNTGSQISGTDQVGSLAVGIPTSGFGSTGLTHWSGPDQDLGYVIAYSAPSNNHPTPDITNKIGLSSTYRGTDVNLSNSAQTAYQQFGYQQSVLGQTVIQSTDKVMFSILVSLASPSTLVDSHFIGIGKTAMNYQGNPYGAYPGNDNLSTGYSSNPAKLYYNGNFYASNFTNWGDGDLVDVCLYNNEMWVRVNGGWWNNVEAANPATPSGGITTVITAPYYPVLCPGYEGTMTIQNISKFAIPQGYSLLGKGNASVGFVRSLAKTEESFISKAEEVSQNTETFATGIEAKTWLNSNGYWTSWTSFGSSGFQWMTINSVTSTTASGIGQNSITIAITQDSGGMASHSGMYNPTTFPEEYGVPISGTQIQNNNSGVFTAIFSQAVLNPLVAFASVGQPGLQVPVISTLPFTPIFSQATTYQSPSGPTQYTQFTGEEGFNIIRIDGTVSSVSFTYTVSEVYCTVCFGFVDQNA